MEQSQIGNNIQASPPPEWTIPQAMIELNLKGNISQNFQGKKHELGFGPSKLTAAHPVNSFP